MSKPAQDIEITRKGTYYKRCEKCNRQTQHVKGKCIWHSKQTLSTPTKIIAPDKKTLDEILNEETITIETTTEKPRLFDNCPECGRKKATKNPLCYQCKIKKETQKNQSDTVTIHLESRIRLAKKNIERWEKQLEQYKKIAKKQTKKD